MVNSHILIREAKLSDISTIIEFLCLEAHFQGSAESVEVTPIKLERTLFGEKPLAHILLAEIEEETVGFAAYYFTYSSFLAKPGIWLDDLYVKTKYRRNGVGNLLMKHLCQVAHDKGCARVDWTVASTNAYAIKFYERLGASIIQSSKLCRFDCNAIAINA